ncbi:MAG: hypothetical protein ACE5HI_03345 [bacterium]
MKRITIFLFATLFCFSSLSYSQDNEADARKLYLEASRLIREENYQEAKILLEKILSDYLDTEIALKADERLNEILDEIEKASLPQTPGIYINKRSGELLKLQGEPILSAGLGKKAKTLMDMMDAASNRAEFILFTTYVHVASNEIESFIIFNPNQTNIANVNWVYTEYVDDRQVTWMDVPKEAQGRDKYVLYPRWTSHSTNGDVIKSVNLLKSKLEDGMYEIKFPKELHPKNNLAYAILDGSRYAFPFVLTPPKALPAISSESASVKRSSTSLMASKDLSTITAEPIQPPKMLAWGLAYDEVKIKLKTATQDGKSIKVEKLKKEKKKFPDFMAAKLKDFRIMDKKANKAYAIFDNDTKLVGMYSVFEWENNEEGGLGWHGKGRKRAWNFYQQMLKDLTGKYGKPLNTNLSDDIIGNVIAANTWFETLFRDSEGSEISVSLTRSETKKAFITGLPVHKYYVHLFYNNNPDLKPKRDNLD